jgi:hypothetical protein
MKWTTEGGSRGSSESGSEEGTVDRETEKEYLRRMQQFPVPEGEVAAPGRRRRHRVSARAGRHRRRRGPEQAESVRGTCSKIRRALCGKGNTCRRAAPRSGGTRRSGCGGYFLRPPSPVVEVLGIDLPGAVLRGHVVDTREQCSRGGSGSVGGKHPHAPAPRAGNLTRDDESAMNQDPTSPQLR